MFYTICIFFGLAILATVSVDREKFLISGLAWPGLAIPLDAINSQITQSNRKSHNKSHNNSQIDKQIAHENISKGSARGLEAYYKLQITSYRKNNLTLLIQKKGVQRLPFTSTRKIIRCLVASLRLNLRALFRQLFQTHQATKEVLHSMQ